MSFKTVFQILPEITLDEAWILASAINKEIDYYKTRANFYSNEFDKTKDKTDLEMVEYYEKKLYNSNSLILKLGMDFIIN